MKHMSISVWTVCMNLNCRSRLAAFYDMQGLPRLVALGTASRDCSGPVLTLGITQEHRGRGVGKVAEFLQENNITFNHVKRAISIVWITVLS